jgi:hypothetical protein
MILTAFTLFHVLLSLVGIATGFVMIYGMITARPREGWTTAFLWSTAATTVTGFLFPFHGVLPSHIFGVLTTLLLALALMGRYRYGLSGRWRRTFAISTAVAQYLNVFILVVQLFRKTPFLKALAPTESEPPFQIAQLAVLIFFIGLTALAASRFRAPAGSPLGAPSPRRR